MIASDHLSLFIDAQAPVSIAVIGESYIQTVFQHKFLQPFDVRRTCVPIDVHAVRLRIDDIDLRSERLKDRSGDVPRASVGAVQANLHSLE